MQRPCTIIIMRVLVYRRAGRLPDLVTTAATTTTTRGCRSVADWRSVAVETHRSHHAPPRLQVGCDRMSVSSDPTVRSFLFHLAAASSWSTPAPPSPLDSHCCPSDCNPDFGCSCRCCCFCSCRPVHPPMFSWWW